MGRLSKLFRVLSNKWVLVAAGASMLAQAIPAQSANQPLIDIQLIPHSTYTYGCCDPHFWPSLNFQARGVTVSSSASYSTASFHIHVETDNNNPDTGTGGGFYIYVRGTSGEEYRLTWSCTAQAEADGYQPGANLPTVVLQVPCKDPSGQGNFNHTTSDSGVIEGIFSGGNPDEYRNVTGIGHLIELGQGGHRLADFSFNYSVEIIRPNQQPPVAVIAPPIPSNPIAGTPVTLDGTGSYSPTATPLMDYKWTIQDPSAPNGTATQSGPTTQYTWQQDGMYNVTLTVTDSDGLTGTTSTTVTVGQACITQKPPTIGTVTPVAPVAGTYRGYVFTIKLIPSDSCPLAGSTVTETVWRNPIFSTCPIPAMIQTGSAPVDANNEFSDESSTLSGLLTAANVPSGSCQILNQQDILWISANNKVHKILSHALVDKITFDNQGNATTQNCWGATCAPPVPYAP